MATVNQLKKIYDNQEKFEALTSTELAEYSGFLKAEEEIGRNKVNKIFRQTEYALQSAAYNFLAETSAELADATAEFATVSYLNRLYEIRYNEVFYETYGLYPNSTPAYGWKEEVEA